MAAVCRTPPEFRSAGRGMSTRSPPPASSWSVTTAAVTRRGEEKAAPELRLAKAFLADAKYRIVANLKRLDRNHDPDQTAISDAAYEKLGYGYDLWEQ